MFNLLEGDGVIENIYHLLWTRDSIFGTEPYVNIPDSILYKYQKPCYWYFTSHKDNRLKKKSTIKLDAEHIKSVFTKNVSKSGIVAYYIYKKKISYSKFQDVEKEETVKSLYFEKEDNSSETGYVIEYFDRKKFDEFLFNKLNYEDGLLQKFEDPKGEHNFMIRVIF